MFRIGVILATIGATVFFAVDIMRAQDEKVGASAGEAAGKSTGLQGVLSKLIPEGQSSLNVTIPSLAEGILKTLVKAASITRQDDENLAMVSLVIEMYDGAGEIDMSINMETAKYHLPTGILESDRPTQISNGRFDLTGEEGLVYDSNTQQGKLPGKVTMIVYNLDEAAGEDESADDEESIEDGKSKDE